MKRILGYLKPYIGRMLFGFSIKFTGSIMDLFLPWILAYIIDNVIPTKQVSMVFLWGALMIVCSIFAVTFNIIANRMAARVSRNATERIRHDLFSKICYLSNYQTDSVGIPSLISRMTTDTYNIHHMLGMMQRMGVRAPILLIGGIIVTLTLDPVLTLVLICVLPFIALVTYLVTSRSIPMYKEQQQAVDKLVRKVRENIVGIRVIKALSKGNYEKGQFQQVNTEVVKKEKRAGMTTSIINPSMSLLLNLGLVGIIVVGAYRVNSGLTEVGKIIAFLTYFTIILNAMLAVTRIFVILSKASASANRIDEVLSLDEDLKVEKIDKKKSDYHIEFNNVSFSYNNVEKNINNLNFKLKKGESLGIIGSTGSGKTTVINLLMRLYDVTEGEILINGENVKSIDKELLSQMFGIAFQNDTIFEDTILENVTLGRGIEFEDIESAAEWAQALDFIKNTEATYESKLAIRGANLSGGQKQRLLITRAIAGKPEILILDDSSSALDYKTDASLRKEIDDNLKDSTKIVIAQRVSSVMGLTKILVLEDGEVIGYGTHEELMNNCDIYKEISISQMGGVE